MEPKDLVTTKEMSQKLQEAGWDKKTVFWWRENSMGADKTRPQLKRETPIQVRKFMTGKQIRLGALTYTPAPTFQEIWEALPDDSLEFHLAGHKVCSILITDNSEDRIVKHLAKTTGNAVSAAAQAWLWCKEKGYL